MILVGVDDVWCVALSTGAKILLLGETHRPYDVPLYATRKYMGVIELLNGVRRCPVFIEAPDANGATPFPLPSLESRYSMNWYLARVSSEGQGYLHDETPMNAVGRSIDAWRGGNTVVNIDVRPDVDMSPRSIGVLLDQVSRPLDDDVSDAALKVKRAAGKRLSIEAAVRLMIDLDVALNELPTRARRAVLEHADVEHDRIVDAAAQFSTRKALVTELLNGIPMNVYCICRIMTALKTHDHCVVYAGVSHCHPLLDFLQAHDRDARIEHASSGADMGIRPGHYDASEEMHLRTISRGVPQMVTLSSAMGDFVRGMTRPVAPHKKRLRQRSRLPIKKRLKGE